MASNKSKGVAIFRVVSGNFLEMYDFMVYGFYATAIAKTFFPGDNPFASLMLSLATFGAGFLMRPLGAVFLGAYIDRHGRRQGLIITLGLMAMGTLLIAFVPGYATLGVAAPLLVLFGRLLQGFSAGVELGGVSVYLSEIATPGRKGFFVSWQSASQQVAVVFAGLLGVLLNGRVLRPHRAQAIVAGCLRAGTADRLPGAVLAGPRAEFRRPARRRVVAVVPLQQLQRRDGGGVDRGDAGGRAHYRFLPRLQPGYGDLRWFHPGGLHLADPHPGQPRGPGHLAQWRGAAGAARHPPKVAVARL